MANSKNSSGTKKTNNNVRKTNTKNNSNSKVKPNTKVEIKENNKKNSFIMKTLVFLGVLIFCFTLIYLMYYYFVANNDIKINMSTDKQIEYITLNGNDEMIITQKYVSDLFYSMRYDMNDFRIFKYKDEDIYKNLSDERILVVVEKSNLPESCTKITSTNEYNSCYVKSDDFTEYYYISSGTNVYKITIKTPGSNEYSEGIKARVNHMLSSFSMTI